MEEEISNLFPNGVRALVVDNDARFLTSSSMILPTLNFKVGTCRSLASALKLVNREKIKDDVDAILVNAEKAAECNFDFRGIVESNMCIPVLYFLPPDQEATGDEAALLRPGTNTTTIKKPLDSSEVYSLWRGIAWRKFSLEAKDQAGGGHNPRHVLPAAVIEALLAGASGSGSGKGRKRKSRNSNPGGSSCTSLAGNQAAAMRQQQMNQLTEGQERDNNLVIPQQERRGMEANGTAPMFQQHRAMDGRQPVLQQQQQQQQQQSLFVQSVLRTLDVPPYNPRIYADTAWLSDNAGANNTDALPPALAPPPVNPSPVPVPPPRPVYPAARNIFGATAPSTAAVATMAAGVRPPLMFRPSSSASHQGPPPPDVVQQDMFGTRMRRRETEPIMLNFQQPPAGDLFTGMASGAVMTFGTSSAAATPHAGAYSNPACSLLQSLNLGADGHGELSAMVTMNTGTNPNPVNPPLLAPHHVGVASNEPAMEALYDNYYCYRSLMAPRRIDHRVAAPANQEAAAMGTLGSDGYIDYGTASAMSPPLQADHVAAASMEGEALDANNFSNYSSVASSLAPDHQVLGTVSNVNEQAISGGASSSGGDNAAASFAASQDLVAAAPNVDQLEPGALDLGDDDDLSGSVMGSHQGPGTAAMDGDAGFAAMSSADQYPAQTIFSMEELLGPDDDQQDIAAGTSLIGGEGGNGTLDIGVAGDLDDDFILGDLWNF